MSLALRRRACIRRVLPNGSIRSATTMKSGVFVRVIDLRQAGGNQYLRGAASFPFGNVARCVDNLNPILSRGNWIDRRRFCPSFNRRFPSVARRSQYRSTCASYPRLFSSAARAPARLASLIGEDASDSELA